MDSFTLQATAHRIGGAEANRSWGPWSHQITPTGDYSRITMPGRELSYDSLDLRFSGWTTVRPGLLSALLELSNLNGQPVCPGRPVLLSTLPCDVPLYSTHIGTYSDMGVYSVGLIIPRSAWTPADMAVAAEAAAA